MSLPSYRGTNLGERETDLALAGLREFKTGSVALNGHGETTIVPGWFRTIGRIAQLGAGVNLTSNFARPFTDRELEALLVLTSIVISFDTDDAELLKQTRRSVRLENIVDNIQRLQRMASERRVPCPPLVTSCVVHTHNVMHLDRLVRFCAGLGMRGIQFCNLTEFPEVEGVLRVRHVSSLPRTEMAAARDRIAEARTLASTLGLTCEIHAGLLDVLDEALTAPSSTSGIEVGGERRFAKMPVAGQTRNCLDPWFFAMVRADAQVMPCCYHPVIGSLKEKPLGAILNGEAAVTLRRQLMTGELCDSCIGCPARPIVGVKKFEATLAAEVPPNWAAGNLMRAAVAVGQLGRKIRTSVLSAAAW
jgi:MoaA/NifB/PqqE/SkfB family radical SAM enzyme